MRRLLFFVNAALVLTGGSVSIWAQHSGAHASGGGSSSGGHSAASSGFHSGSAQGHITYPTPIGLQPQPSGHIGINTGALPLKPFGDSTHRFVNTRTGRGSRYGGYVPYAYYPYFPLFDDYDNFAGYNNSVYQQSYPAADPSADMLSEQVDRLSAEVDALRSEREQDSTQGQVQRPRYNAPPMIAADETPSSVPVTLVLKDGKQVQLKNFAVMGREIWDFSSQPIRKIALANVDLEASEKATEAAGGEFLEVK